MKFIAAAGSMVVPIRNKVAFQLVIEVICPKCGTNVSPTCLSALNAKGEAGSGRRIDGIGLITPCCHMVVAMDDDFSRWVQYQFDQNELHPVVTLPFSEKGMMCDISHGVETVGLKETKTEADYNPLSGTVGP